MNKSSLCETIICLMHIRASKLFKFIIVLLLNYVVFLLLNFWYLKSWSLSGDDLFSLSNAIPTFKEFLIQIFTQFSGQYRHLTYLLFSFYNNLLPNFFVIFLVNGLLLSLIPTVLFFVLDKKLANWIKFLITLPIFLTPIFYYHAYTISSLANELMCVISLVLLYYFNNRERLISLKYSVMFLLITAISFTIKETFILPISIYCLTQLLNFKKNKKQSVLFIFLSFVLFITYSLLRLNAYQKNIPTDYFFVLSTKQGINNLFNMLSWIVNYPKGWQYGSPIRFVPLQYFVSLIYFLMLLIAFYFSFLKDKLKTLSLIFFIIVSISIFVFLNSTLVFYMDLPFLLVTIIVSQCFLYLLKKNKSISYVFLAVWILINFTNLFIIKPQWLEYSFVANSNKSAKNYKAILDKNNFQNYDQICILDHHRGGFGTEDGKLVEHLKMKKFKIISTKEKILPKECLSDKSLNLVNDAWNYYLYKN